MRIYSTDTATPAPASFQDAIPTAVSAWNKLVATPAPRVLFCEEGTTNSDCNERNEDDYVITFKVVAGDKTNNGGVDQFGYYHDCGKSVACVRTTNPDTYGGRDEDDDDSIHNIFAADAPTHLEDLVIVIEDPAWEYDVRELRTTRFYWSNDKKVISSNRGEPVGNRLYLPSLMMHEFGHTAGLMHPTGNYRDYDGLMGFHYSYAVPSLLDVQKMIDTYLGHTSHE